MTLEPTPESINMLPPSPHESRFAGLHAPVAVSLRDTLLQETPPPEAGVLQDTTWRLSLDDYELGGNPAATSTTTRGEMDSDLKRSRRRRAFGLGPKEEEQPDTESEDHDDGQSASAAASRKNSISDGLKKLGSSLKRRVSSQDTSVVVATAAGKK